VSDGLAGPTGFRERLLAAGWGAEDLRDGVGFMGSSYQWLRVCASVERVRSSLDFQKSIFLNLY
jgi:hypothetical protein